MLPSPELVWPKACLQPWLFGHHASAFAFCAIIFSKSTSFKPQCFMALAAICFFDFKSFKAVHAWVRTLASSVLAPLFPAKWAVTCFKAAWPFFWDSCTFFTSALCWAFWPMLNRAASTDAKSLVSSALNRTNLSLSWLLVFWLLLWPGPSSQKLGKSYWLLPSS